MAVEHQSRPLCGVQFHPESVLTESGHRLLANFLSIAGVATAETPAGDFHGPSVKTRDPEVASWGGAGARAGAGAGPGGAAEAGPPIHW